MLDKKSILVTGSTGSFGRAFVRLVLERWKPKRLVVFSRDELKQYEMAQELDSPSMRYFLGDVRDLQQLTQAMAAWMWSCTRPHSNRYLHPSPTHLKMEP